jgi:hypothetical protein
MEITVIFAPVSQAVNEPGITVEVENDRLILGEETVEIPLRKTMRVLRVRFERRRRSTTLIKQRRLPFECSPSVSRRDAALKMLCIMEKFR